MRTVITSVTFARPFMLPGFDRPHAPGSFEIRTDHERLGTTLEAWRRTDTRIMFVESGLTEAWPIDPRDLEKALLADGMLGR